MSQILTLPSTLFDRVDAAADRWLLPTLARIVFAGVLLIYFWASAMTKLGDGPLGFVFLDFGAYAQIFPHQFEAVSYNPAALGIGYKLVAIAATWAEFLLPLMVVLGLLTRLAALGMIVFIVVMSATDILGHGADAATIGAWFDRNPAAPILDQRAFWVLALLLLVVKGGGPLALDRLFRRGAS